MSDVIERLLEVEQRARRIIEEVEQEAVQIVERAREEARRIAAGGREKARREAEGLISRNARALQQQREARIEEERRKLPSADSMEPEKLARAVRFAVSVIACADEAAK